MVLQLLFLSDSSSVDGLVIASIVVCIVHAVSTYQVIVKVNESYPRSTKKILKELFVIGSTEKVLERPYALELRMRAAIDFRNIPTDVEISDAYFVEISNCLAWSQNLTSLSFSAYQLSTERLRLLCAGLHGNKKLKTLTISHDEPAGYHEPFALPEKFAESLASLEHLSLEGMDTLSPSELLELGMAIKSKGTLETLQIACARPIVREGDAEDDGSWDWLYPHAAPRVLGSAQSLVNVAFCSIDDSLCLTSLLAGLRTSPTIKQADFSGSRFSFDGTNELARWIEQKSPLEHITIIGLLSVGGTARAAQRSLCVLLRALGEGTSCVTGAILLAHDGGYPDASYLNTYVRTIQVESMNAIHSRGNIHTLLVGFTLPDPLSESLGMDPESGLGSGGFSSETAVGNKLGNSAGGSSSSLSLSVIQQLSRSLRYPVFIGLNGNRPERVKSVLELALENVEVEEMRSGLAVALDRCVLTKATLQTALRTISMKGCPIRWISLRHNPLCTPSLEALCALAPLRSGSDDFVLRCYARPSRKLEKLDLMGVDIDVEGLNFLANATKKAPALEILLSTTHIESSSADYGALASQDIKEEDEESSHFAAHMVHQIQSKGDVLVLSDDDWLYRLENLSLRDIAILGDLIMHSTKIIVRVTSGAFLNLDALRTQPTTWWRPTVASGTNPLELYLFSSSLSGLLDFSAYEGAIPATAFSLLATARQVRMAGAKKITGPLTVPAVRAVARVRGSLGSDAWQLSRCSPLSLVVPLRSPQLLTSVDLRFMDTLDFTLEAFLCCSNLEKLLVGGCSQLTGTLSAPLIEFITNIRRRYGLEAVDLSKCGTFTVPAHVKYLVEVDLRNIDSLELPKLTTFEGCGQHLKTLMFDDCPLVAGDIAGLAKHCHQLTVIGAGNTGISASLEGVAHYLGSTPRVLRFHSGTEFEGSISALNECTSVMTLDVHSTAVAGDLSGLNSLRDLRYLDVSATDITGSLSDLGKQCLCLEEIHADHTAISGPLSDLQPLKLLRVANFSNSKVSGRLSDLDHFVNNLRFLSIDGTAVEFAGSLVGFTEAHPVCRVVTGVGDGNGE